MRDLSWLDRIACAGMDPDIFFPERGERAEAAKVVCRTCPWVRHVPEVGETCLVYAMPFWAGELTFYTMLRSAGTACLGDWNDRQTDVGAVLGMTLQALIAELCKPTSTHHREGVTSSPEKKGPRGL